MSHQSTTTDFDKFTTFKITTGQTVKRTSNESHDDESKKLKLEKSGSVVLSNTAVAGAAINPSGATQQTTTHLITSNNALTAAAAAVEMQQHSKKLKSTRMKLNETSASSTAATTTTPTASSSAAAGYSLIVEDATATTTGTGTISEESSESLAVGKTFTTTTAAGEEQLMFIRKHVTNKGETVTGNLNNDGGLEERIIHIEGDPSGNATASYITAMSTKPPPKRLQIGMAEAKKSLGDSIDLKLITTSEGQGGNKISMVTGDKKPEQILISASNTTINPQNTFTYSRVCSVTGQQGEQGSVNIKSLQGAVNKQSLMVSSKKLLPEVTQTTAKVSIGNTTISVPLLKPLSSTQIIQTGGGNTGQASSVEGGKSVIHTIQTGGNTTSQTQLSKILNIKRGQKVTQPTYVSFSQLQIKPVTSTKIVQAKVVSKKIPVQIQAVQTNKTTLLQQTSGVVTITSTKPDPHNLQQQTTIQGHILPSPQKKQQQQQQLSFVKEIPAGAIIKTTSTANIEEANSSSSSNISNSSASDQQTNKVAGESTIKILEKSGQLVKTNTSGDSSTNPSIIATEYLPASVKVVHTSGPQQHTVNASNIRSTLAAQMDNAEHSTTQQQPQQTQQQRINICPTISIVRQNSPQLVTTSGNVSTVSLSMADAVSGQQKQLILTKSQFANVSAAAANVTGSIGNSMTTNFPRNISLMLAKSSASQQVFTTSGSKNTLCVTTAAGSNKLSGGTRLNLNIQPNVVNSQVTTVAANNQNDADLTSGSIGSTDNTATNETGTTNVQQQQQQQTANITQNRKIIQVIPGIYSSSDGSYVKITKTKAPQEDDEKKKDQHQQHIHLQIQQQQQQQNTPQQQQNHVSQQQQQQQPQQQQIHMQIQQQQQQQQNHPQQIHIQQIQNAQHQRQQQLQQHRQQLLHKQQMQQIQKQQQHHQLILNQQQQQQQQQSQDTTNATTTSSDNNATESTITTTTTQLTNVPQTTTATKFTLNQNLSSSSASSHYIHSNTNTTTTSTNNEPITPSQQQQQSINLPKPEESNNVLLKQLLQNSNTTPNNQNNSSRNVAVSSSSVSSTAATTVLPARKVINVRAPSLGLVSSLEAQLARPVIPPVPASESSTQATHSQTPPITNTSQTLKLLNDNMKTNSNQQNISSVSNLTHTLNINSANNSNNSSSTTNTNTPSLIISTTKTNLIQHSDKPKISSSSPLISKETSFVSKPQPPPPPPPVSSSATQLQQQSTSSSIQTLNKEHSEQNIEIFSLQQTLQPPETLLKEQPKSQIETTTASSSSSSTSVPVQITTSNSSITSSQQSFKQFLQANATANQNQATLTTKITKYVQDVKKAAAEQQQQQQQQHQQQLLQQQQQQHLQQQQPHQQQNQQQQLSVNRTFTTTSNISNVSGLNKDKISGNVILNTHGSQQNVNTTTSSSITHASMNMNLNVSQGQTHQQFVGNMQQNKTLMTTLEGNQVDSNIQAKVGESQSITTSITQQKIQQQMQQQQQQQPQQHTQQSQNQMLMQHIQQQHDPSKQTIKMEVDETQPPPPSFQQMQQVQLQQQQTQQNSQQQQQQSFKTSSTPTSSVHNTLTSPMSTTPTNSVVSTPTNEQPPHIILNNKQQLQHQQQQQQQQQHIQQHMPTNQQQQHQQQQFLHTTQNIVNAAGSTTSTSINVGPTSTGNTTLSSPSLAGPNSASKEVDRKKRKREQQKPRKQQIIGNTKDTAATSSPAVSASTSNAANAKKRSRKSLKLEEDYDSYIDNLLSHMRQMQPLQVLEPQLNINYDVCNIYGWRNFSNNSNSNSTSPVKESRLNERSHMFERELEGEYGAAHLPNKVPFYDFKSFMDEKTKDDTATSTIQNNYYDQEFTSFTYKTEPEKLSSWVKVYRERAIDTPEIVSNKLMPVDPVKTMRLNMLQQETFPGLILMSSTQQKLGRMSPVIPFVSSMALITKRKKTPLKSLDNDAAANGLYTKDIQAQDDFLDNKAGIKNSLNNQNVILSLPTSSAERLLDVLKNLANLLQLPSPIPYKIVDNNGDMDTESEQKLESTSSQVTVDKETIMKQLSLQNILNGKYKMCRHCGKAITGRCIKNTEEFTKTKFHSKLVQPTKPRYFCNKVCYIQFRWSIEKKPSLSELKSVLESKSADTSFEAAVEAAAKEGDLDLLTDKKDSLKDLLGTIQPTDTTTPTTSTATSTAANTATAATVVPKEETPVVKNKKIPFRYFSAKCFQNTTPVKRMSEKEIRDLLFKMDITMSVTMPQSNVGEPGTHQPPIEDRRQCVLCSQVGDGVPDGPSRLLNFDVDKWVHLNCALWSSEVYETISGGLVNFHLALQNGLNQSCNSCQQLGATVKCYKTRCGAVFHLPCAIRDDCVFYQNKTIHCQAHAQRSDKDNQLMSLSVPRRVFVERDENRQVAAIMHHSEMKNLMRVGSLIFLNVGQLLPHQLEAFHTPNYIYPIGYKIIRFYWSMHRPNKRCRYICSIAEVSGRPEFRIVVQEPSKADVELRDSTPKAVWQRVLQPVAEIRKTHNLVKLYPEFISGEDLFGLTEPSIVRIIESLPGVETLTNYRFKYGRNPLLDLPLALNPSGAARTEPKLRQLLGWKKHHPQRTCSNLNSVGGHQNNMTSVSAAGEVSCPYSKQFVHSKSSQYKKMKQEWRNNVYLARSKIQGLGLYAARDMERHTMIIEYIGEVIRSEVSEIREKQYEARNRGIYMFRLDEDRVVDATLSGGLARYINHSCNPNCVTEIVEVDRELRIIIFAKRRINRGEELSYDYKFDLEDEGSKIPCMCGAPNCRKWMN